MTHIYRYPTHYTIVIPALKRPFLMYILLSLIDKTRPSRVLHGLKTTPAKNTVAYSNEIIHHHHSHVGDCSRCDDSASVLGLPRGLAKEELHKIIFT